MKVRIFSKWFLMPFSNLRPQVWFSKLYACTLHTRFGKPSSSFNRALILDASLSWLAFLPNNATLWWLWATENPQRQQTMPFSLSWPHRDVYCLNFVRAHVPKQCKRHKREQCHFQLTRSASVCTRRSFSVLGTPSLDETHTVDAARWALDRLL